MALVLSKYEGLRVSGLGLGLYVHDLGLDSIGLVNITNAHTKLIIHLLIQIVQVSRCLR